MLIKFTEAQELLRDTVREFTKNEVEPRDRAMDENGFDWELFKKISENGFMGVQIPEEYGGGGGSFVDGTIVVHEMAKGSASAAAFLGAHWLGANLILDNGTEEQKKKYLPMAANDKIFAFGLTEASAGSDAAGIKSICEKQADGSWILNGGKAWITNSGVADYYIILALTDPSAGTHGISAFILPKDTEGLTVGKFEKKMGMRGTATCELAFDNIHLPADALLGKEGKGFMMAMQTLDIGRFNAAAMCAGICEHAMEIAKKYANERTTFGKPIKAYQGVSFRFADMVAEVKAMEFLAYDAAYVKDAGKRCTVEAACAKLFASEHGLQICIDAQQVLGGNGYSAEYDVERFVRDIRMWGVGEGSTEILRMVVSGNYLNS